MGDRGCAGRWRALFWGGVRRVSFYYLLVSEWMADVDGISF